MSHVTKVLFVCVHNAGRSQMAEAFLRKLGGSSFDAASAGFEPRPINPLVVEAMNLIGIDMSEATSKSVFDLFRAGRYFDYVITVCDESSAERCPVFPGMTRRLGWSFADPSAFEGTHEQQLNQAVRVRDEIRTRIESWLKELPNQHQPLRMPDRPSA
jgi:arsenate reductase (thioredoxin)